MTLENMYICTLHNERSIDLENNKFKIIFQKCKINFGYRGVKMQWEKNGRKTIILPVRMSYTVLIKFALVVHG